MDNKFKIASDSETFFDAKPQATLSDTCNMAPQLYVPTDGTERGAAEPRPANSNNNIAAKDGA
jgi:hypothetical protein